MLITAFIHNIFQTECIETAKHIRMGLFFILKKLNCALHSKLISQNGDKKTQKNQMVLILIHARKKNERI